MGGEAGFFAFTLSSFGKLTEFTITALPLFILMAAVLQHSGLADDMYEMVYRWMGGLKGGLAMGTIIISALFAAMVGISTVATATLGITSLPSMRKRGTTKSSASGSSAPAGRWDSHSPEHHIYFVRGGGRGVHRQALLRGCDPRRSS